MGRWVLEDPDGVEAHHRRCLALGARAVRTVTFQGHAAGLEKEGLADRVNEVNWTAARIACEAAEDRGAAVFGWVGPTGLGAEEAYGLFREQLGALLDGGCRLILFEGFSRLDELVAAVETLRELHHCPAVTLIPDGLAGEAREVWQRRVVDAGADVGGVWMRNGAEVSAGGGVVAAEMGLPIAAGPGLYFGGAGVEEEKFGAWVGAMVGNVG